MNATQRWLAEQDRLRVEREAQAKQPYFNTYDDYAKVFPDANWRHMVDSGKVLIATYEGQSCVPGDYYIAWVMHCQHYKTKEWITEVVVNNGDDGYVRKKCATLEEANQELNNLKCLAPFFYGTLVESFGYRWD
jgi:hypothetical protein